MPRVVDILTENTLSGSSPVEIEPNYAAGVGSDLFAPALLFLVGLALCLYLAFRQRRPVSVLDPNSEAMVAARNALRVQRVQSQDQGPSACPICLEDMTRVCGTNCGHIFCAPCLLAYWEHGLRGERMSCPCCRRDVTLIMEDFTPQEKAAPGGSAYLDKINNFNRRFVPRSLMDTIRDIPAIFDYIMSHLSLLRLLRIRHAVVLLGILAYIISPFDLIPEAIYGVIGLVDDLLFAIGFVIIVALIAPTVIRARRY